MESFQECVNEYKKQLETGVVKKAYQRLMKYILELKTYFKNKYPDYSVSGSIYYGYMDMTYFSLVPQFFKQKKLKIAIVFIHDKCRFEIWLAGYNKNVQLKYWKLFKEKNWKKYNIVSTTEGADSILEFIPFENPDFGNLDALTKEIDKAVSKFMNDIESFLSNN